MQMRKIIKDSDLLLANSEVIKDLYLLQKVIKDCIIWICCWPIETWELAGLIKELQNTGHMDFLLGDKVTKDSIIPICFWLIKCAGELFSFD